MNFRIFRPAEALRVLHKVLQRWRDNGFALVHYGFIYKTSMNDLQRGKIIQYLFILDYMYLLEL